MRLQPASLILAASLPAFTLPGLTLPGVALAQAASDAPKADAPVDAGGIVAQMKTADGKNAGTITFVPLAAGMLVEAELTNLPPGTHGFHVHQTGACTPDFAAAGEHLAPDGHEHGFARTDAPHMGDIPNIVVDDAGNASAQFLDWRLTKEALLDSDGSAAIVHADADDYMDSKSAGDRIACGTVGTTESGATDGG